MMDGIAVNFNVYQEGKRQRGGPRIDNYQVCQGAEPERINDVSPALPDDPQFKQVAQMAIRGALRYGVQRRDWNDYRLDTRSAPFGVTHTFGNEFLDDRGESISVGLGPGRHVANGLGIEPPRLPAGRVDPPVRCQVGMDGHASPFESNQPDEIEEEGLAGTVLSDDEPDGRTPVGDPVHVAHESIDLSRSADLDMREARPRNDAGCKSLEDDVAITRLERRCGGHAARSRARS